MDEARKRVANIADSLADKYGLKTAWNGDSLGIKGSGVTGTIVVAERAIDVEVKLSFPLAMMESTIRTSLEDAMDEHLL